MPNYRMDNIPYEENHNVYKFYRKEVEHGIPKNLSKYRNVQKVGDEFIKSINGKDYIIIFQDDATSWLQDYWDKADNPGAYQGRDKLFNAIKSKHVGLSRRDIAKFLGNNETSQIHQTAKVVKVNRPFSPKAPCKVWAVDLVFITNANDEPIFTLFNCIDEFSKFAFARVVADKTSDESARALREIFEEEKPNLPSAVRSDNGNEFKGEMQE